VVLMFIYSIYLVDNLVQANYIPWPG